MTELKIIKTVYFKSAPEHVWEFLTDKDKLALWFNPVEASLASGQDYKMLSESADTINPLCWGRVTKMEPPKHLEYTFQVKPLGGHETLVDWLLEPVADGTKLTMTHSGFGDDASAMLGLLSALDAGWDEHFAKLRMNS